MKIQIINQEQNSIDFLVEREEGMYNNVNVTAEFTNEEIEGLTQGQIYQLAWDKVKHIVYRVFEQIEPLDEPENFIGFEVEPLPIPPEPEPIIVDEYIDEEKIAIAEAIIDLEHRISILEGGK